jgi:hypothetical protein
VFRLASRSDCLTFGCLSSETKMRDFGGEQLARSRGLQQINSHPAKLLRGACLRANLLFPDRLWLWLGFGFVADSSYSFLSSPCPLVVPPPEVHLTGFQNAVRPASYLVGPPDMQNVLRARFRLERVA